MKLISRSLNAMLVAACILTGCQSANVKFQAGGNAETSIRNDCYSLLHQLLDAQKNVSVLRFIKRESADVKNVIKKIAAASGAGAKRLEDFAKADPSIHLDETRLPAGEVATRDAIASTKKKELLGNSGDEFELSLLLTETEALSYAWHLAKVAGEHEIQPERARELARLSEDMKRLYQEVFGLLLSKTKLSLALPIKTEKN